MRAQRREYMQLLSDCQRLYCEARLALVADVVAMRLAEYMREPLPSLTRCGCSYLMQVWPLTLVLDSNPASIFFCMPTCRACHEVAMDIVTQSFTLSITLHVPEILATLCICRPGFCPSSAVSASGPRQ